jgi:glycosyltransferase involved in cell wall biosynthesis
MAAIRLSSDVAFRRNYDSLPASDARRMAFKGLLLNGAPETMKVLIVTFAFPPSNVIGAIHVGKLARYLDRGGHDVRVLTTDLFEDRSLPLEIPSERVIYTAYPESKSWLWRMVNPLRRRSFIAVDGFRGDGPTQNAAPDRPLWRRMRRQFYALINIPDMRASWIKTALPAGRRLIEEWMPDIIYASAPPYTGLVIAGRLSRSFGVPWVANLRDLWVDNPYYREPGWRRPIDAMLEWMVLRNAARLVTVSPIWAEQLSRRHGKPANVVYNGYAEEDFPPPPARVGSGKVLTIRYLGSIYPGFRDPSALFAAIALLPKSLRRRIMVEFYGDECEVVLNAAAVRGVTDAVAVRPRVAYRRALELQMQSDVLLLLQWNDRRDEGNLPAKLFEYLYARRPILFIGYEQGIAARLVNDRGAGLVSNNPAQISDQLRVWITDRREGRLERLDPTVSRGLSRDEQHRKLERLFLEVVTEPRDKDLGARRFHPGLLLGCERKPHAVNKSARQAPQAGHQLIKAQSGYRKDSRKS